MTKSKMTNSPLFEGYANAVWDKIFGASPGASVEEAAMPGLSASAGPREERPVNSHFDAVVKALDDWRTEDHEDSITLHRSVICYLLDGINALRACGEKE